MEPALLQGVALICDLVCVDHPFGLLVPGLFASPRAVKR